MEKAINAGVQTHTFNRESFYNTNQVLNKLNSKNVDLIVLAGFMWLVPENIVHEYSDRMMNIHPALLPKYGGKGMYGMHVHNAVKAAGEKETGITIHLVNKEYDKGRILFQAKCMLDAADSPEDIAQKINVLEHVNFPTQIELYLESI